MAFQPTNKIDCDKISLKYHGDNLSYFYNIPYQSNYSEYEKAIRETCEEEGLEIDQLQPIGGGITSQSELLNIEDIKRKIRTKARLNAMYKESHQNKSVKR